LRGQDIHGYVRNVRNRDGEPLLSTTEVAELCGVAAMTVVRWIDNGALPAVRTPGGWRRVRRSDAERHAARVAGRLEAPTITPSELAALLTAGKREALVAWARAHGGTDTTVGGLIRSHLAPAMREIGEQWECGDTAVAEEHRATGLAYDVIALLRDMLPAPAASDGDSGAKRLMMVCPDGEQHALPARMAAERFVDAGWRVDLLGADVPAEEVARQLAETQPNALGVSVTTSARGARTVLRAVAAAGWQGAILAGGALAAQVVRGRPDILLDDGSPDFIERVAAQIASTREQTQ
jgi:excisionase family DNA binding protein